MNRLQEYFEKNTFNAMNKWTHYFDIYDRHFNRYVGKDVVVLEIGVFQGGSLKMWKNYFGDKVQIYAIDIFDKCKQFEDDRTKIFIGSQSDKDFLDSVKNQIPPIDILIDDGGHFMDQQIISFEHLFSHIKPDGVYLCEDLHTSYWKRYGGGYKNPNSFIEYSKNFIDYLNAWHTEEEALAVNDFTRSAYSMHYYDSVLVIEKKAMQPPETRISGEIIIDIQDFPENNVTSPAIEEPTAQENELKVTLRKLYRKFVSL